MIAMTLLGACATGGSEHGACPPVVAYSVEDQQRMAAEVHALPQGSVIFGTMADYHVLRQQVQACGGAQTSRHG
mgnify:CR=1 FL=1